MLAIKIELWPHGDEGRAREIGRMYVANDGTGTIDRSDYKVAVCKRGTTEVPREVYSPNAYPIDAPKAARAGRVEDYARNAYNVWRLIARAVLAAFPEEAKASKKVGSTLDESVMRGLRRLALTGDDYSEDELRDCCAAWQWLAQGDGE